MSKIAITAAIVFVWAFVSALLVESMMQTIFFMGPQYQAKALVCLVVGLFFAWACILALAKLWK